MNYSALSNEAGFEISMRVVLLHDFLHCIVDRKTPSMYEVVVWIILA